VDNTAILKLFADGPQHSIFLRPARWGKSLLLSTMKAYYCKSISKKDREELFEGLEAGKTMMEDEAAGSYHVLDLDLSIDVDASMPPATIRQHLYDCINASVIDAAKRYELKVEVKANNALYSLGRLAAAVSECGGRMLTLVDEYDRFANKLMFENPEAYSKVVAGIPGDPQSSPIRAFFETMKKINHKSLTMGISNVGLADASGPNHMIDLSDQIQFSNASYIKHQSHKHDDKSIVIRYRWRGVSPYRERERERE